MINLEKSTEVELEKKKDLSALLNVPVHVRAAGVVGRPPNTLVVEIQPRFFGMCSH